MKKQDIDVELLLNLIFNVPDGYDITTIDFTSGSIKLNMSFDYVGEFAKAEALQREIERKQSSAEYQEWVKQMDAYFEQKARGALPEQQPKPKRKRGRPRKCENAYSVLTLPNAL